MNYLFVLANIYQFIQIRVTVFISPHPRLLRVHHRPLRRLPRQLLELGYLPHQRRALVLHKKIPAVPSVPPISSPCSGPAQASRAATRAPAWRRESSPAIARRCGTFGCSLREISLRRLSAALSILSARSPASLSSAHVSKRLACSEDTAASTAAAPPPPPELFPRALQLRRKAMALGGALVGLCIPLREAPTGHLLMNMPS